MAGATGKLDYGVDYDLWLENLRRKFSKRLWEFCNSKPARTTCDLKRRNKPYFEENSLEVSLKICNEAALGLLVRVCPEDRGKPKLLLDLLRKLSPPFRILDLPTELRLRIYEMNFSGINTDKEVLFAREGLARTTPLPSLTKVCRKMRVESLPLYISSNELYMDLPAYDDEAQALHNIETIRLWAEKCAKAYVKHLRFVTLFRPSFEYTLTYSEKKGLKLQAIFESYGSYDQERADAKREQLRKYAATIEADGKALNLEGESIILALIKDPKVWISEE